MNQFLLLLLLLLLLTCKSFAQNAGALKNADIIITEAGISYKGTVLPFEKNVSEWEKALGKTRRMANENAAVCQYIWDDNGFAASTMGYDASQPESNTAIREFYVYYRNFDSKIGHMSDWSRYMPGDYYNPWPEDFPAEGQSEKDDQRIADLKWLKEHSKKKPDFAIPYTIHRKPILIGGALIDSTMTVQNINDALSGKGIPPFHYTPATGGVNSHGNEYKDTAGKYNGEYTTNFGNDKKRYYLKLVNWKDEVIYIMIRIYSRQEMEDLKD